MDFIERVAKVAVSDWRERRIMLPSVVIAQAIKESGKGTSELALRANALFGIKKNGWTGKTYVKDAVEQRRDGSYYIVDDTEWRAYDSWEESVIDHNTYIATRKIENQAEPNWKKVVGCNNYVLVVRYLQDAQYPYATSKTYAESLINNYIEKYNLTKYDEVTSNMPTVFLSAGHGGNNPGAVAYGLKEKDINLQALLSCKEILEKNNIRVVCSRVTDENDPVQEEVKEANTSGCDLAVSFHANAGGGDGFEAFCNLKNDDAVKLSKIAEKNIKALGQNSRGIKDGMRLYFVKNTKMTAILFETFFLDNVNDNKIGDTVEEQRKFGVAYAKAILEYFNITYKEDAAEEKSEKEEIKQPSGVPYLVRVTASALNVRIGAGLQYKIKTEIKKNEVYTIVEERNGWGKLKSGAGWIRLKYTERV